MPNSDFNCCNVMGNQTTLLAADLFLHERILKGTPVYLIMKISGHKREKDFYRYIRIGPKEAAEKIKVLWMERDEMEVFKDRLPHTRIA